MNLGPGWGRSSLSTYAQISLTPDVSSSSSGRIPRCYQASQETWSLQHVVGLPRGLLQVRHACNASLERCSIHLSWLVSVQRCSGSTPSSSWVAELLILSLSECYGHHPMFTTLPFNGTVYQPHNCRGCTNPPVHLTLDLSNNPAKARHPFLVENNALRLGGADCHPSRFTLGCTLPQHMLKVLGFWGQQDIICRNLEVLKLDSLQALAMSQIISLKNLNRTGDEGQPCWSLVGLTPMNSSPL